MRGPKPQYPIALTTEEKETLQRQVKSRKAAQGQVLRARIVLAAHEHPEWSNQQDCPEGRLHRPDRAPLATTLDRDP